MSTVMARHMSDLDYLIQYFDIIFDSEESFDKLNDLILSLAVQGKLVEQNTNEEPASVLLEKMKAEKEKLIQEGKIKRQKELPPIEPDEIPYEIPESWVWVRLGEVGHIIGGGTPKTNQPEYWSRNGIPWLTPADLYKLKSMYISKGKRDISIAGLKKSSAQLLPKGSVLFSSRAPIGYVAINDCELATNQGFKSIVPFLADVNVYIYYYLKVSSKRIDNEASGTTFREISGTKLAIELFPLPPLNEQKRIVEKIESLQAKVQAMKDSWKQKDTRLVAMNSSILNQIVTAESQKEFKKSTNFLFDNFDILYSDPRNVKELRQAILQLAVQGKLVEQDPNDEPASVLLEKIKAEKEKLIQEGKIKRQKELPPIEPDEIPYEIPYEIPEGWDWVRLGEICYLITDGTHTTPSYVNHGVPFLSVKDIAHGFINFSNTKYISYKEHQELSKRCKPEYDDILLTKVGTTGIAKVVDTKKEFSIFVSVALLKHFNYFTYPLYLENIINSPLIKSESKKYTMGVGNKNLVLKYIKKFLIPLPPLNEQKRIVEKIEQLMSICDSIEKETEKLSKVKSNLLLSVLNGSA